MSRPHTARRPAARPGFTLIELLVVVSIIVILIAILIPALGHVKSTARAAATKALMSNLMTNIDAYYTTFHAYPGPMSTAFTTNAAAASKISGAQNMLLGLSYSVVSPAPANSVALPTGAANVPTGPTYSASGAPFVAPSVAAGPTNYGVVDPNGRPEHFSAFFSPSAKQLSPADAGGTTWPNGGIAGGSTGNDFAFPVVIDTYPDALPILYYRRTPGVENVASSSPVRVASSNPTTEIAPYYLDENKEYTAAPALTALNGTQFDQRKGSFAAGDTTSFADFGELVQTAGTTPAARGGYVLLSAGSDRTYGKVGGKFDDGVVVGGH
jgi:prepilin-type N-terminal cleavage/methylation domain-containing protein